MRRQRSAPQGCADLVATRLGSAIMMPRLLQPKRRWRSPRPRTTPSPSASATLSLAQAWLWNNDWAQSAAAHAQAVAHLRQTDRIDLLAMALAELGITSLEWSPTTPLLRWTKRLRCITRSTTPDVTLSP